jgi:hypothetical protein
MTKQIVTLRKFLNALKRDDLTIYITLRREGDIQMKKCSGYKLFQKSPDSMLSKV